MISLCCAIACSALISILMRLGEGRIRSSLSMFLSNYAVCTLLALLFGLSAKAPFAGNGMPFALGLGIVSGVLYLASFVLFRTSIVRNGIILSSTFMKLGVLIPTVMAIVFFHDRPGAAQYIGIALAVSAILLLHLEKGAPGTASGKGLLPLLLLASGLTDATANIFDKLGNVSFKDAYLTVTFFFALVCTALLLIRQKELPTARDLLWGVLIGIPNYFSSRFLLGALKDVPAVVVYPVYSVGTIVAVTLAGTLLFREVLSRRKIAVLITIAASLILLNL